MHYIKTNIDYVLDNYELYDKYKPYQEKRWEIHIGDALTSPQIKMWEGGIIDRGCEPYYRVKKVYATNVAVDLMIESSNKVYDSMLVNKSFLLYHFHQIYNSRLIG